MRIQPKVKVLYVSFTFLILLSCSSKQSVHTTVAPTPTIPMPTSTLFPTWTPIPPPPPLGPVPSHCPITTPTLHIISPNIAPVIGASPVWAFWTFQGSMIYHLTPPKGSHYPTTYDPPYGWDLTKVIWEVGPSYTQLITIRGQELYDHTPLVFSFTGSPYVGTATLDPTHPNHPFSAFGDNWAEWGSTVIIPKAGCYTVVVSWPQGSWQVTLAVGA